jgi:hypothetical protein
VIVCGCSVGYRKDVTITAGGVTEKAPATSLSEFVTFYDDEHTVGGGSSPRLPVVATSETKSVSPSTPLSPSEAKSPRLASSDYTIRRCVPSDLTALAATGTDVFITTHDRQAACSALPHSIPMIIGIQHL